MPPAHTQSPHNPGIGAPNLRLAGYLTIQFTTTLTLKTNNTMGGLLYTIAVILLIVWAIGFFGYHAGGIIHVLLVIAIIAILLRVIRSAD
jgi:Family of unknown function (DUF5670)